MMETHQRVLGTLANGPVRRNLFGPVDREQLQAEYQSALQKDLEEASHRWGFDFILDKPLESGDFQWESIPGTKVPLLYRPCMLGGGQAQGQRAAEAKTNPKRGRVASAQCEKENIPSGCVVKTDNLEKTPQKRENTGLKRRQTNITGEHDVTVKEQSGGSLSC